VFLLNETTGQLAVHKVSSTPEDHLQPLSRGSWRFPDPGFPDQVTYLAHGTTVATNAIIEQREERSGFDHPGFRDLLEIGRQTRPRLYDLHLDYPPALVSRDFALR
jgi:N-methylhydantoinase A